MQYTPTLVYLQISWKIYHLFLFRGPLKIWAHLRLGYTFIGSCNFLHFKSKNATIHRRRKQIESEGGGWGVSLIRNLDKTKKHKKNKNKKTPSPPILTILIRGWGLNDRFIHSVWLCLQHQFHHLVIKLTHLKISKINARNLQFILRVLQT